MAGTFALERTMIVTPTTRAAILDADRKERERIDALRRAFAEADRRHAESRARRERVAAIGVRFRSTPIAEIRR